MFLRLVVSSENHLLKLERFVDIAKDHIQESLERGLSDVENPSKICRLFRTTQSFLSLIVRINHFWWTYRNYIQTYF